MLKQISILILIGLSAAAGFAQTEKYSAPIKWERYKVGEKGVSVLLPKMPVLVESADSCAEQETKQFAVYADQTVYGLTVTYKTKEKAPKYCIEVKGFNEKNFEARLLQVKEQLKDFVETEFKQDGLTVKKISGTNSTCWLINDFANKKWFELWVLGASEEKTEVQSFVKSIKIGGAIEGIEIGSGSDRTFGDETVKVDDSQKGETSVFKIALKARPGYTDAARDSQVQGVVRLRITFLASGGIGSVTPVIELTHGLTEQAIKAARKIVFIPQRKNGTPVSVTKLVEYSFSIY